MSAVVLAMLGAAAAVVVLQPEPRHVTSARDLPAPVPAAQVLSESPYMGVACSVPNSVACDRVGLAVWTRRPALAVRATVAGRTFALDDPEWSEPARPGQRRMFAGFLNPAGLLDGPLAHVRRWEGEPPVYLRVRIVITYADRSRQATVVRVTLSPGWG